ncbi:hypothetical protein C8R45DRAFT_1211525 [Mycena sanguinolenta]|nr:hypothetical protein C8R45DRAFT_1211525 [Mycena sanguinolenta]
MKRGFLQSAKEKREKTNRPEYTMLYTTIGDGEHVSECFFHSGTKELLMQIPNFPQPLLHIATPAFRMVDIPGKGTGLVSTRALKMGDLILCERPLFVGAREMVLPMPPSLAREQLRQYQLQKAEELFEGSLDRMRPEAKAAFMALCNCHKDKKDANDPLFGCGPLLGIVNTNGLSLDGLRPGMPDETKTYSVVCKHMSRLNHSCSPNTMPQFDDPSFSCRLYAVRDIAAGEELTYKYISTEDVLRPAAARQAALKSVYDFVCSCSACEDPSVSDPRRAAIAAFAAAHPGEPQLTIDSFGLLDDTRLDECRKQAALIEREGLENLPVYFTVLKLLVEGDVARQDADGIFTSAQKLDKCHWISACDALQDNPLWRAVVDDIIPNFQAHRKTRRR